MHANVWLWLRLMFCPQGLLLLKLRQENQKTKTTFFQSIRHLAWISIKCAFSVSHGGKNYVTRHAMSAKHSKMARAIGTSSKLQDHFPTGTSDIDKVKVSEQTVTVSPPLSVCLYYQWSVPLTGVVVVASSRPTCMYVVKYSISTSLDLSSKHRPSP